MTDWRTCRLRDLGRITTGKTPPTSDVENYGGAVPFVTPTDMDGRRTIDSTLRTLSSTGTVTVKSSIIVGPAIVVSCIGSDMGKAAIVLGQFVSNQQINSLTPNPENDAKFIYYNLLGRRAEIRGLAGGAAQPIMNKSSFGELPIDIPPLADQQAIGDTLGKLDDKIELNRRMNETLEAMAQAIFRDWFVDFGPVRRKLAGETDPVAIVGGLTPDPARAAELAAMFPAVLDGHDLPQGWIERPLDQIAEFLNGLALQKFPAVEGELSLPVIKIAELRNGLTEKSNRASPQLPDKYIVGDGDYLFSWSGSLMAKVWTEGDGALNQHLFKVSSNSYPQWFFASWVEHHLPEFQRIAASKATTMGHIQRGHLTSAMTVCPPQPTLDVMATVLAPLWDRRIHNDLENRTLAETRDYLLPRLMSGAVRVGELPIAESAQ